MDDLNDLLRPVWGPQKWISQGWDVITDEEKQLIKDRLDHMFKNGLPFELKHDKLTYIHVFALLAQVEVIAIQIPLKFESKMSTPEFQRRMRVQLLDEIFHSLVFTKILYLLCEPYALPPAANDNIEKFCQFIRNEECPKVAVVLLNLIAEGWIEALFICLQQHNVAPDVFDTILEDERRHVSEADLYYEMGLSDKDVMASKVSIIEELFFTTMFYQYNISMSLVSLVGFEGVYNFVHEVNKKHIQGLEKINLTPGLQWWANMQLFPEMFRNIQHKLPVSNEIEMTLLRKMAITQWSNPADPTMVAQFNIDVSCLDLFNKKFPAHTLPTLILQTISQILDENSSLRLSLYNNKVFHSEGAYVGVVVKLPGCGDHLGNVAFLNCHKLTISDLFNKIRIAVEMMVYCYKKREQLENQYPGLKAIQDNILSDMAGSVYGAIPIKNPSVCLTNLGSFGYSQGVTPLVANEVVKFMLLEVDRRQVWNKTNKIFEARDLLPVSVSADHRVFDANIPLPKIMAKTFQDVFQRMKPGETKYVRTKFNKMMMEKMIDQLLEKDLGFGYMLLTALQSMWPDYLSVEELFSRGKASVMEPA